MKKEIGNEGKTENLEEAQNIHANSQFPFPIPQ